jgi:hypothetical protein
MEGLKFLSNKIKEAFIGGVFEEIYIGKNQGGQECLEYMTLKFRLGITIIACTLYAFILRYTYKKLESEILTDSKPIKPANLFEKFLGWLCVVIFFIQVSYKINSGQLIFILNPCHTVTLVEAYLLIRPNGLRERTVYTVLMNTLFSPWIALVFPVTTGLDAPFEVHMFWVEHMLCAVVNPLVLSLSHRYYNKATIRFRNHLFAHSMFGFYQRLVLFPLSMITHANLNFTLCAAEIDPFEPFVGIWYYIISDLYIFIGGEIFHKIVKILLDIVKKIEALLMRHSHNKDDEVIKNK